MAWYINGKAAAGFGISNIEIRLINLDSDECTLTVDAAMDGTITYDGVTIAAGTYIIVTNDAVVRFQGICQAPTRTGSARTEGVKIVALGPWERLKRVVYLQTFPMDTGASGAYTETNKTTAKGQISGSISTLVTALLTYPTTLSDLSSTYAVGTVDLPSINLPLTPILNQTVGDLIRQCLRFVPDAVSYVNYAVSPPTINIVKSASTALGTVSVDIATPQVDQLDYHSRDDIAVPNVVIDYYRNERVVTYAPSGFEQPLAGTRTEIPQFVSRDYYPSATPVAGSVVLAKQLSGDIERAIVTPWPLVAMSSFLTGWSLADRTAGAANYLRWAAVMRRWRSSTDDSAWDPSWYMGNVDVWTITGYRTAHPAIPQVSAEDAIAMFASDLSWLTIPPELAYGSDFQASGAGWYPIQIRAHQNCYSGGTIVAQLDTNLEAMWCPSINWQPLKQTVPESAPTGAAQTIYDQRSALRYQGTIGIVGTDPSFAGAANRKISLVNGSTVLATGLIQQTTHNVANGRTTLQFGPPEHLSTQDLIAMLQL